MKNILFILVFSFCLIKGHSQDNLYDLTFQSIDGSSLSMNDLKTKKVIVVLYDAINPDRSYLRSLDSLYKRNTTRLAVIAVPATDFNEVDSQDYVKRLWLDTLKLGFWITVPAKVKKGNGTAQHELMQWLTDVTKNKTFNNDIKVPGEMFVIDNNGRLYASLQQTRSLASESMRRILEL
jgi:glutathione peroxidase-family protein